MGKGGEIWGGKGENVMLERVEWMEGRSDAEAKLEKGNDGGRREGKGPGGGKWGGNVRKKEIFGINPEGKRWDFPSSEGLVL